jgi:hypothetical protein
VPVWVQDYHKAYLPFPEGFGRRCATEAHLQLGAPVLAEEEVTLTEEEVTSPPAQVDGVAAVEVLRQWSPLLVALGGGWPSGRSWHLPWLCPR